MKRNRAIIIAVSGLLLIALLVWWMTTCSRHPKIDELTGEQPVTMYGIEYMESQVAVDNGVIESGQTLSSILLKYGIGAATIDRTVKASEGVFNLRNMRAGHNYTAFLTADSLNRLTHFVYEQNLTEYFVISYIGDSVAVRLDKKDVRLDRQMRSATINSSLWNAMIGAGMSPALSMELSEIYAWSVDFFGLREGDHFTVIYDEKYVDTLSVGVGKIWGAIFNHAGKDYYAIPFKQGSDRITYWDENGNSLRKSLLKAPLKYSRISSKFSHSRLHPVLRIRRPHHGVDYAAPSGTPVHAVADGTVIFKGWDSKGGGNTLKIKHASNLMTGYLHLKGFAKGISNGSRVSQGDLIGYVGSTGTSTGPHLDYRIWQGGKAIDPLKVTSEPAEPITKANREKFDFVKERILAELCGELADSLKITQLDSLVVSKTPTPKPDTITVKK